MGLGSMNEKNIAEVLQFKKFVKEKKNEGKENDQRCKGERGEY
jgi:hypothetical protein